MVHKFFDFEQSPPRAGWSLFVAGNQFDAHSEAEAIAAVATWRQHNGTFVSKEDVEAEIWAVYRARQPNRVTKSVFGIVVTGEQWKGMSSANMWRALHRRAKTTFGSTVDAAAESAWLRDWEQGISCNECEVNWRGEKAQRPPDHSSPEAYFAWTVAVHNAVNRRIEKAELTVEQALALY